MLTARKEEQSYSLFNQADFERPALDEHAFIALLDEPVTYIKEYAKATGSINTGFLLSFLISETEPEQWFRLNSDQIRSEIGMTVNEFRLARKKLSDLKILVNKRSMLPTPISLYQINDNIVDELIKNNHVKLSVLDLASVPLGINRLQLRAISHKRGSIKAVIFMAAIQELICDEPFNERGQFSKWVEVTDRHIASRTALSRNDRDTALSYLVNKNIVEFKKEGFPVKKRYRVNYQKLGQLTADFWMKNNRS